MASAGHKRPLPYDDLSPPRGSSSRASVAEEVPREKPRDWRDAFLDDPSPPRRGESHRRDRSRDRTYYDRDRGDRNRDRERDYRRSDDRLHYERERERDRYREGGRDGRERRDDRGKRDDYHHNRERSRTRSRSRERADSLRRYGNSRHRRRGERDTSTTARSERSERSDRGGIGEQEEGECVQCSLGNVREALGADGRIAPSPPAPAAPSSSKPPQEHPPRGFQSVKIPSGPRSTVPVTRPISNGNALDGNVKRGSSPLEEPVVLEEEVDPEKALEERRKRREEIMKKFKATGGKPIPVPQPGPSGGTPSSEIGNGAESVTSAGTRTGARTGGVSFTGTTPLLRQLGTRSNIPSSAQTPINVPLSIPSTPLGHEFDLTKGADTAGEAVLPSPTKAEGPGADDMISAADYDPSKEGFADQERRQKDREVLQEVADGVGEPGPAEVEEWEEFEQEVEEEDDDVDMFAAFGGEDQPKKKKIITVRRRKVNGELAEVRPVSKPKAVVAEVLDNVDDGEGYYRCTPGEILDDGRYQVTINLGKGMFSGVVKAKVLKAVDQERRQDVVGKEVAIKVVRSQESMYVAGRKEVQILKKLNDADPEDKKHIVRMERTFEHRGHLCIVTESLSMNLRDVIKRFGKDVGLNMRAVRAYAHQLFLALSLMRKCSIVHADIKPDNVLVSENKATLKVCDLGSASEVTEGDITPYLVSRFYRAPEIILGLPYDMAIDIWSIGCTLYELYTGKILFPGRSNNHMLLLHMELKGKFNHRMIKKATFGEMHFDESMNFISIEKDKITGQDTLKTLVLSKATKDLRSRLMPPSSVQLKMKDEEVKQLQSFIDLLDKCLQLDPMRRITPRDALSHPFLAA